MCSLRILEDFAGFAFGLLRFAGRSVTAETHVCGPKLGIKSRVLVVSQIRRPVSRVLDPNRLA